MKTILTLLVQLLLIAGSMTAQNPPIGLQTSLTDSTTVQLEWQAPLEGQLAELAWTNGTNNDAIGLYSGGHIYPGSPLGSCSNSGLFRICDQAG